VAQPFYRLPKQLPVVWTSPTSVQVGITPPLARITDVPDTAAPLIHAVSAGTSASGLRMIARNHRVSERWLEQFVDALHPVFSLPTPPDPPTWALWSRSNAIGGLMPLAHHSGIQLIPVAHPPESPARPERDPADGIIVVADYLIHPHWLSLLAHERLPHCPVVFSDQAVTVGPRITLGDTPCLVCVESHHRDHTPEWLEVASQLWGRVSPLHTPATHGIAWALVVGLMTSVFDPSTTTPGTRAIFRPGTGDTLWEKVAFHPRCMCRGPGKS
jgi:hypothetical protein